MNRAIKFKNNDYLDSSGIVHKRKMLQNFLIDEIVSFSKSLNISQINTWYDSGIVGKDLTKGTYIMEIFIDSVLTQQYTERLSGVVAWHAGGTNSNDYDEIPLSKSGHARNKHDIKIRILRRMDDSVGIKLQISDTIAWKGNAVVIFHFRKLI